MIFTSGPVLAAITASYFFPEAAIFTAMGFISVGTLLFLSQRKTQPPAHPREVGDDHSLLIKDRFIQALFIPMMAVGAFFGSTGLVLVGYLDEFGIREYSGFYIAIWSFSSGISAFISGSLRTARDAAEIMRPVMAVPGPITSPTSDGCHRLIGERLAEIVTSVPDALELILPISGQKTGTLSGDDT